jgi:hypothetical protein
MNDDQICESDDNTATLLKTLGNSLIYSLANHLYIHPHTWRDFTKKVDIVIGMEATELVGCD